VNTWQLLRELSTAEWRAHPWRQALAVLAVALGVALAFSVHLINQSALAEFSQAVRSANGQPDAQLVCAATVCDDALADTLSMQAGITLASPVLEVDSYALTDAGQRVALKLMGVDALQVFEVAPDLLPRAAENSTDDRFAALDPTSVFLNAAAQQRLKLRPGDTLRMQHGLRTVSFTVRGQMAAAGPPLAVADLAGVQSTFELIGRLSRIDLRLAPGFDAQRLSLPAGWRIAQAQDGEQRVSQLSRAYRVNLTVLALVALFVGGFLVFSVLALSVAQRVPQFALLGVLGLSAAERGAWIRAECLVIGLAGSVLGVAAGTGLAKAALAVLAGDLGGGYFPGIAPALQWSPWAALVFAGLGVVAALIGGWLPAQQAAQLAPAQALKGLGGQRTQGARWRPWGWIVMAVGGALAFAPPIAGLPLAAYVAVALLLIGGIACVPQAVAGLVWAIGVPTSTLPLLAVQRARHDLPAATVAVAGVVASLALAVAITVMVASFRQGVTQWLDQVLPADLYARTATSASVTQQAYLPPGYAQAAAAIPGVARVEAARVLPISLAPQRPRVALISRRINDPAQDLPLLAAPLPPDGKHIGVFVSEAMAALYGAQPGHTLDLPLGPNNTTVFVRAVWRDYARQFGAVVMDERDYQRLTSDMRHNDLALWLTTTTQASEVQRRLREIDGAGEWIEFASAQDIRQLSLRNFDRSFAVTYYLQAVAITIGLAGIVASFSAQALARRREFGLLVHLGFTRRQIVAVVAGEGATWTAAGTLMGLALGLIVAAVLVHVVNPQSFHWTMELLLPWPRLAVLCIAVIMAGSAAAAYAARRGASQDAVQAVKEDW
jgi:putative ABC transport system permease protein